MKHFYLRIGVILTTIAIASTVLWVASKNGQPTQSASQARSYTIEEMVTFWKDHLESVFTAITTNKYRLPTIQERFNTLSSQVNKRFGRQVRVNLVQAYAAKSSDVIAGAFVKDREPNVDIIIPKLMDLHKEMRSSDDASSKTRLENLLVISLIHEYDHLAHSDPGERSETITVGELMADERHIWALTCEHTIRPFVEIYREPISKNHEAYYRFWLMAKGNENDPVWIGFIRHNYGHMQK